MNINFINTMKYYSNKISQPNKIKINYKDKNIEDFINTVYTDKRNIKN